MVSLHSNVEEPCRLRIGLVVNDLPTVESKAPSQFGGVLLASARHAPLAPDKGYNTHDTLWCTPQPRRSPLSRRFWLCQFIFGLHLSRGVTLVRLVCCFVVRSSPSARGGSGARRLFQDVMIAAYSAWGLALSHVGFPVHVWRCRRPSPYGGLDPLRRETSTATVAIHASGGRCSTRPCAHAIGPSSFSAVRRQVGCPVQRRILTPRGEKSSQGSGSRTCAARFYAS